MSFQFPADLLPRRTQSKNFCLFSISGRLEVTLVVVCIESDDQSLLQANPNTSPDISNSISEREKQKRRSRYSAWDIPRDPSILLVHHFIVPNRNCASNWGSQCSPSVVLYAFQPTLATSIQDARTPVSAFICRDDKLPSGISCKNRNLVSHLSDRMCDATSIINPVDACTPSSPVAWKPIYNYETVIIFHGLPHFYRRV